MSRHGLKFYSLFALDCRRGQKQHLLSGPRSLFLFATENWIILARGAKGRKAPEPEEA